MEIPEKCKLAIPLSPFVSIFPKELRTVYSKDTHIPIFIAAPFIIAKQPVCLSADAWIKCGIYTQWMCLYTIMPTQKMTHRRISMA